MFRKSLILLATTAILLPMEAVYADDKKEKRVKAQKERAVAPASKKKRVAKRSSDHRQKARMQRGEGRRATLKDRGRDNQQRTPVRWSARGEKQSEIQQDTSRRRIENNATSSQRGQRFKPRGSTANTKENRGDERVRAVRTARDNEVQKRQGRSWQHDQNVRQERSKQQPVKRRAADRDGKHGRQRARTLQQMQEARSNAYTGRSDERRGVNTQRRSIEEAQNSGRYRNDGRRRGRGDERGRGGDRTRDRDYDRRRERDYDEYNYRDRDNRRSRYSYNHRRNRRDWNFYFGFGNYFGGYGYSLGYNRGYNYGYRSGYRHGYWYGDDYDFFGHWPLRAGYYGTRAHWLWHHSHHHYHYGEYCPNAHNRRYSSGGYYHSGGSDEIAGILLGGIVGGIIGAEIDGGRDRTAGAVIGSVVGASIGANASKSDNGHHYSTGGGYYDADNFDANGRHRYENEPYRPPQEIRTCMRYEDVRGNYICTKWSVEYIYDED